MSIAQIYKESNEITIIGSPEELEALGQMLIAKSKLGKNLSGKLVDDNPNTPNINIETYDED